MRSFIFNADIFWSIFKTHNLNHPPCPLFLPNFCSSVCFYLCFYILTPAFISISVFMSLFICLCCFDLSLSLYISHSDLYFSFLSFKHKYSFTYYPLYFLLLSHTHQHNLHHIHAHTPSLTFTHTLSPTKPLSHHIPTLSHIHTQIPTQSLITNTFTITYYLSLFLSPLKGYSFIPLYPATDITSAVIKEALATQFLPKKNSTFVQHLSNGFLIWGKTSFW